MMKRLTNELKSHSLSIKVYGEEDLGDEFVHSIADLGILTPLSILSDGTIVSGHRRWRAAKQLDFKSVPVEVVHVEDELEIERIVIESNRQREKTFSQKMREAEVLEEIERKKAKERQAEAGTANLPTTDISRGNVSTTKGKSRDAVAKTVGIGSGRQYSKAKKVWKKAKTGDETARGLVKELDEEEVTITGAVRTLNREAQKAERKEQAENILEALPAGKYHTIVIDPPWPTQKILRKVRPHQDMMDYPTMTIEEIAKIPVQELAYSDGCHIYLWVTHKYLPAGLHLFEQWGVRYQCLMTWVKNVGMTPFSWMYSTEHVLFGRIGSLKLNEMGLRLDFSADVTRHSEKPEVFYQRVAEASPSPRLEMFARKKRVGFTTWGDEINA